jgi:hypothetical protein
MMSEAVMHPTYDMRRLVVNGITKRGVAARYVPVKYVGVLDTDELLSRLERRGIRNIDIARVLGLPDSRVPEIRKKTRKLSLDEGAKLIRAFELEQGPPVQALPLPVIRLLVLHIARRTGVSLQEEQVADLAEDLRAFAEYAADPRVRGSVEAAEGFFRALQIRAPSPGEAAPRENDHEPTR